MLFKVDAFEGVRPRVSPRLLGPNQAEVALDCELLSGDVRAIEEHLSIQAIPSGTETVYYHNEFDTWRTWTTDVDVARGTVAHDKFKRIYTTGDGAPKVIGNGSETYDLGVPAPTKAPTVQVNDRTSVDDWTPRWNYFYEEADGTKADAGHLDGVSQKKAGQEYALSAFPDRENASDDARFVPWMEALDENDNVIGVVYPNTSVYSDDNTFFQDGAKASMQVDQDDNGNTIIVLAYDTQNSGQVTRSYVYTFVSIYGEEGPPSEPSQLVNVNPSQQVTVGGLEINVAGNRSMSAKRIYRTNPGLSGTSFQFVDEVPIGDGAYEDTALDSELAEVLLTANYFPPPEDLSGLIEHPNGFLVGFVGRDIYFSVPDQPHAWPTPYVNSVDYDIVALGIAGNSVVVMTKGFPYFARGTHPEQIVVSRVPSNQPCVSKRSKADIGYATLYASNDGLVMVSDGVAQLVTRDAYLREHWRGLNPQNMHATVHDQIYFGFSGEHAVSIDFAEGRSAISSFSAEPSFLFTDLETDILYFVEGNNLMQWRGGTDKQEFTWRSGQFNARRDVTFAVGRLVADAYPCTLNVVRDGVTVETITVNDNSAFRLPPIERGRYWQLEAKGRADMQELLISTSMREL